MKVWNQSFVMVELGGRKVSKLFENMLNQYQLKSKILTNKKFWSKVIRVAILEHEGKS